MTAGRAAAICFLIGMTPAPAAGQTGPGLRGYAAFGATVLAASQTFRAVARSNNPPTLGGGAQVTRIWKGVFADVGLSQHRLDGERVFVADGTVLHLGIPLEITMRPVDVAAGWRFTGGRLSSYAGGGATILTYRETSEFATPAEDVNETRSGLLLLGGVDVPLWRWIHAGAEIRFRRVTGLIGQGGASAEFGEDDAGGFSAGVRVSVGR